MPNYSCRGPARPIEPCSGSGGQSLNKFDLPDGANLHWSVGAVHSPHYGLEHIGLTVDDVDAAVEELRDKGAEIAIGPLTRNPGLRLAFIRGPEGIMIELVQR